MYVRMKPTRRIRTRGGTTKAMKQTDLESRNELGEGDKKEVEVEEELELFVEYDGEECESIIFLISYDVRRES